MTGTLKRTGGGAHVFELGHGEVAAEQSEAAIGCGDQAIDVDMVQRLAQAFADIVNRFDLTFGNSDNSENDLRRRQALE